MRTNKRVEEAQSPARRCERTKPRRRRLFIRSHRPGPDQQPQPPKHYPRHGQALRDVKLCTAAHNAVGLAGESPVVGIDCLPT
jgi:hypothetical protein